VAPVVEVVAAAVVVADGGRKQTMSMRNSGQLCSAFAVVAMALWLVSARLTSAAPQEAQQSYASPEEAAAALASATRSHDQAALRAIFGPGSEKLLSSGDRYADEEQQRRFATAYEEKHTLVPKNAERVELDVGNDDWPLPIPIVQSGGRWQFDTHAGAEEIINRRIGRNELAAIRVALAYVEAQKAYFDRMKQQTGTGFYAQRLISTPGRQDGLYWRATAGSEESPFAAVIAEAEDAGYAGAFAGASAIPYRGYYFHVLKAQGPDAPGGAVSYVKSGQMTGGFALIAWPASYGSSGIMTFLVDQDGVVFQKDLGPDTAHMAPRITQFDPDLTWTRIEVTNQ
jgi:hypothetical protein